MGEAGVLRISLWATSLRAKIKFRDGVREKEREREREREREKEKEKEKERESLSVPNYIISQFAVCVCRSIDLRPSLV